MCDADNLPLMPDIPRLTGKPKVSIVIPCFNPGRVLLDTIESCARQSYRDFEIVIVNDGSDDPETLTVLESLSGTGVVIIHTENQGVSSARNLGIRKATGEFILPLDADDLLSDDFLRHTVPVLEVNPDVGVVSGRVQLFGEVSGPWRLPEFSVTRMLLDNMVVVTSLFRKEDYLRLGGFRSNMSYGWEDWDFWLSMVELGRQFVMVPESEFYYRTSSVSRDSGMKLWQKIVMYACLIMNHKKLYLSHPAIVFKLSKRLFYRNSIKKISPQE